MLTEIAAIARNVRQHVCEQLGTKDPQYLGRADLRLCEALHEAGYKDAIVCKGRLTVDLPRPAWRVHSWIELRGFILDITGDQFNAVLVGQRLPPVVVTPACLLPRYTADLKDCDRKSA